MIGALIGDTVGSVYEFNNINTKDFPLFDKECFLTDDSILTLAIAEIIQNNWQNDKAKVIETIKRWGRAYPDRGYGGRFARWLFSDDTEAYNSFGNGASMRISPVGWYARSEEEVKELSRLVTEVTHNHPEGIKGAEVVAMCIYYARMGKSKDFIREYVSKYYNLDFDYEDLVKNFEFDETCQNTVPQAIYCFLISTSFEDCLRTTISIGGDCDTTAAISCAIAEAYYKDINEDTLLQFMKFIPKPKDDCNPWNVIRTFLDYKTCDQVEIEEISDDTKILLLVAKHNDKTYAEWAHSKSVKALSEYLLYNQLDNYFGVDYDDLSKDLLTERNIVGYVTVIAMCNGTDGDNYKALNELFPDLISLARTNKVEELNDIINKINAQIKKLGHEDEYYIFSSPSEAFDFIKTNDDIKGDIYNSLLSSYK